MNRIMRTALLAGFTTLALAAGVVAGGAEDMAKIIDYRQNIMKSNGAQAADILMIVKGEVPFGAKNVVAHAEVIHALSKLVLDAFPKGSGTAAGKTRAKDEIWSDWDALQEGCHGARDRECEAGRDRQGRRHEGDRRSGGGDGERRLRRLP